MSSRKEDERNEKVIRGLMKLPPNRRCINCNSLGPQYVCTNFWTFVCTACSGIHREFTHRVKSVSMAKFTTAEVEALQKGGNQSARENFLSGWDFQRSRLPDSSHPDRVREFIRNVYVDKKYATGRTSDKPPRDVQSPKNFEEEHRRASSYHSYSQSPPYDYQYEDRRYGKQTGTLSRKPGSDRGLYEGKMSSLVCSPGRLAEQMYEDRFANEITGPRISDYSVSSASDTFKFDAQSPSFQSDSGYASPGQQVREILIEDRQQRNPNTHPEPSARRNAEIIPRPQRTSSSGSFGSLDSNKGSLVSVSCGSSREIIIEAQKSTMSHHLAEMPLSSGSQSSASVQSSTLDLFHSRFVEKQSISSASSIDLFAEINQSSMSSLAGSSLPNSSFAANNGNREICGSSFVPQPAPSALPLDLFAKINQPSPVSNVEKTSTASTTGIALSPSSLPASNRNQDLFGPSLVPQAATSLPSLDLFAEINQPSSISTNSSSVSAAENSLAHSSLPSNNGNRDPFHQSFVPLAATSLSSLDLFSEINQPSSFSTLERTSSTPFSEKEGWATFDLPHVGSALGTKSAPFSTAVIPREAMDKEGFDAFPSTNSNPQWSSAQKPAPKPLAANQWDTGEANISPSTCTQTWNAFDASFLSSSPAPFESSLLLGDGQVAARDISTTVDPCINLKESNKDELQTSGVGGIASAISPSLSSHVTGPYFNPAVPPGPTSHEVKSRNPFDLPYDSDLEHNNGFFDMGSLQATLPAPFMGSLAQPWYTQNPVPPYVASVPSGGLTYAAGQPANSQLPEMPQQGPVASLGGNPFA